MSDSDVAPLTVVHIISGLGQGGAETVLYRLVTAPTQRHHNVVISLGDADVFGPKLTDAGVPVHCLGMKGPLAFIRGVLALRRLLKSLQPGVVQTWMYHSDLVGGIIARSVGIKNVVWCIRNSGEHLHRSSLKSRVVAWVCARLSKRVPSSIVSCAENAARRHKQWGYDASKFQVIPNGYEFDQWKADPALRADIRHELGVSDATVLIGAVARWNPLKDHANLLGAFAKVVKRYPEAQCVLIGHGLDTSNAALMDLIKQFKLESNVMLLGRRDDVPRLMTALDVHVLSSNAEGFPNVVCEAMATEVACVVTDVGDAALIVGEQGVVVPPRNAAALAQGIISVLDKLHSVEDSERRRKGRERVTRLFGLSTMVDNYDQLWQATHSSESHVSVARAQGAKRLLMVVNNPAFFLSHRVEIALEAKRQGYEVHVATMAGAAVSTIVELGLAHHVIPMTRSGKNPLQELNTLWSLYRLFKRIRPNVVHAVTIKPVLYGGIAARMARVPAYLAAVSGLGYIFTQQDAGMTRRMAIQMYRLALGHRRSRVIFQNESDRDVLIEAKVVQPEQAVLIRGSGVDLSRFSTAANEPVPPVVVLMVSRLLIDKGVREFVQAARLSAKHPSRMVWRLAGSPDPGNPASITQEEVQGWHDNGFIQWLGESDDVAGLYAQSHIAVLPSYREGLPKSLVEAAAAGVAVVTTDVPGCRDAIEADQTGLLVPARDATALAQAVQRLAEDQALRTQMGAAGRRLAEQAFDIKKIVQQHIALYDFLSGGRP